MSEPATQPITKGETITVRGTDMVVPVPHGSGIDRMQSTQFSGHDGTTFAGTQFLVSGPAPGAFVGSIQVAAVSGIPGADDLDSVARWVDAEHESNVVEVNGMQVIHWPTVGGADGSDLNLPSRNWSQFVVPTPDSRYVLEIIFDGISDATARDYVERLIGGLK